MSNKIEIGGRAFALPFKFNDQISIVTDANGQDVCSVGGDYVFNWDLNAIGKHIADCLNVIHDPEALHVNILRGTVKLSRANALHIAGAGDYDEIRAEVERLTKRLADVTHDRNVEKEARTDSDEWCDKFQSEIKRLEAEVERLRKGAIEWDAYNLERVAELKAENERLRDELANIKQHFGGEEND